MANEESPSLKNDQIPPSGATSEAETSGDDIVSLEDLDKMIDQADPGFTDSLNEIKEDEELKNANVEPLEVEDEEIEAAEKKEEEKEPEKVSKLKRILGVLNGPKQLLVKGRHYLANLLSKGLFQGQVFVKNSVKYLRTEFPERLRYEKKRITTSLKVFGQKVQELKSLGWKKTSVLFFALITLTIGFYLAHKSFQGGWLPPMYSELLNSFERVGSRVVEFDPKEEVISVDRAFPQEEFQVLLGKIVVNLKNHDPRFTPMGAFEFFLNLNSQETAIEVKDREKEIIDIVQRSVEQLTYKELSNDKGKKLVKLAIRSEVNKILNKGHVQQVFFKTFIVKP